MIESSTRPDRRAEHIALVGLLLQVLAFAVLLGVSLASDSAAIRAAANLAFVGLPIWLILYLTLKQLRRVRSEEFESAELQRAQESETASALFEDAGEELAIEKNRLRWMVKYLLPAVTLLLSLTILLYHFLGWGWAIGEVFEPGTVHLADNPTIMAVFVVFVGLACFWFARYTLALAKMREWQLLHAGAVCMVGNAMACLALVIALMASSAMDWVEPLTAAIVRVGVLVIGIELLINFILDFYRPRSPDYISRPSFDSRLLGLVSEPGGFAKSIADAINYQFGFEVSTTWFYQLLQRWMLPLVVVTFVLVVALSSVVVVNPEEEVIVERFGVQWKEPATLSPGFNLKLPYPIDVAYRIPVKKVSEIVVGEATEEEDEGHHQAILWTQQHKYIPELMIVVASPSLDEPTGVGGDEGTPGVADSGKSVAVSLLMVSIPIEYRIKNPQHYLYNYEHPEKVMEDIVYQLLSNYAASVDIDQLIGPGRSEFNALLREKFQERLDDLELGIELVFVGIRGAHPPAQEKVAAAFQAVISAETSQRAQINVATGEAYRTLTSAAGSVERATRLDEAILKLDQLESALDSDPEVLAEARGLVDELLMNNNIADLPPLGGRAAALIAGARAERSRLISNAVSKTLTFGAEVAAWKASKDLYLARKQLEVFEGLNLVRKYLIVGDPSSVIIEYEDRQEVGLDTVLREGVEKEKSRYNR